MKRTLVAPAILAGTALDELKHWLAITTSRDDAALTALLRAALDMCEAFTGVMPLEAECEEIIAAPRDWLALAAMPVRSIASLEAIEADGTRTAVAAEDYLFNIAADGRAMLHLQRSVSQSLLAVRFTAGLAADWDSLPGAMRQGLIRLAAHLYRSRDDGEGKTIPPASIAALWQPWRRMRIA